MIGFVALLLVPSAQLSQAPCLSLEFAVSRPFREAPPNSEPLRLALLSALRERNWPKAVALSDSLLPSLSKALKDGNSLMAMHQAELLLVSGDSKRAFAAIKPFLEPLGEFEGTLIRNSADLRNVGASLYASNRIDDIELARKANLWHHLRWRALNLLVDISLAKADIPKALEFQEELNADFMSANQLEPDGGFLALHMDSYLLPLRYAAKGEMTKLDTLANFGYAAREDWRIEPSEQRRLVASLANVVLARHYQASKDAKNARRYFVKAVETIEKKPVVVNREVLLWFLMKEELK